MSNHIEQYLKEIRTVDLTARVMFKQGWRATEEPTGNPDYGLVKLSSAPIYFMEGKTVRGVGLDESLFPLGKPECDTSDDAIIAYYRALRSQDVLVVESQLGRLDIYRRLPTAGFLRWRSSARSGDLPALVRQLRVRLDMATGHGQLATSLRDSDMQPGKKSPKDWDDLIKMLDAAPPNDPLSQRPPDREIEDRVGSTYRELGNSLGPQRAARIYDYIDAKLRQFAHQNKLVSL